MSNKAKDGAEHCKRIQVFLDDETVRVLRIYGNGTLSLGIRLMARMSSQYKTPKVKS